MGFLDNCKMLDGNRLSQTVKATIQSNGRLNFTPEAVEMMSISQDSTVLLFENGKRDFAAVVKQGSDPRGFAIKKSGPYFYIPLKNYLEEQAIDYRAVRICFDITKLDELFEDCPIFKMIRRDIAHMPKVQPAPLAIQQALANTAGRESDQASSTPAQGQ